MSKQSKCYLTCEYYIQAYSKMPVRIGKLSYILESTIYIFNSVFLPSGALNWSHALGIVD